MPEAKFPKSNLTDTWGRRNRKIKDRKCDECGLVYRPKRSGSRYCSMPCVWKNNGGHRNRKIKSLRFDGDVAYVPLSQGYESVIDAKDAALVGMFNWHAKVDSKTVYACRMEGGKEVKLHRLLLAHHLGSDFDQVDHKDGNGLNNRANNLRPATHSENMRNRSVYRNSKSGVKGVLWDSQKKKWIAQVHVDKKRIYLGSFENMEDAVKARKTGEIEHHKDFVRNQAEGLETKNNRLREALQNLVDYSEHKNHWGEVAESKAVALLTELDNLEPKP